VLHDGFLHLCTSFSPVVLSVPREDITIMSNNENLHPKDIGDSIGLWNAIWGYVSGNQSMHHAHLKGTAKSNQPAGMFPLNH
jgi:hypothetical protein